MLKARSEEEKELVLAEAAGQAASGATLRYACAAWWLGWIERRTERFQNRDGWA